MEAYSKAYPKDAQKFRNGHYKKSKCTVTLVNAYDDTPTFLVSAENDKSYMLSGVYEPKTFLKKQIEGFGRIAPNTPFMVMGMGNMQQVKMYLEAAGEDCLILVYEPSIEIFEMVMETIDISELILDKPVLLVVNQLNEQDLKNAISMMIKLDTVTSLKVVITSNYDYLFPKQMKEVLHQVDKVYGDMIVTWNTVRRYTDVAGENLIYNMKHMLHGHNVSQLQGMLEGIIPAFVISAGPSLNKNIDELKAIGRKGCIIAVDTAIKPLLNHGIIPDFFVIVDGKKPTELMNHPLVSQIPLVTCNIVAKGIMDLHTGKKFFYASDNPLEELIYKEARKKTGLANSLYPQGLATGGSVANSAFALADYMNASEIVFVGQDLALTNNKTHADGTFQEKMNSLSVAERQDTFLVDGIKGNKVYTRADFDRYRKWFEDYISDHKLKNVIDATQGGAKIHGTKIKTLKQTIEKVCKEDTNLTQRIELLPEMMDYSAKKAYKQWYEELDKKFELVVKMAKKGQKLYEQLEKLVQKDEELNLDEYKQLVEKIGKVNHFMNKDDYALFVQDNLMHLNFTMRVSIYESEEDDKDDRISLAKQGKVMNFYIKHEAQRWIDIAKSLPQERPFIYSEDDYQGVLDKLTQNYIKAGETNGRKAINAKSRNQKNGRVMDKKTK